VIRLRQIKGADSGREFEFDQSLIRIGRMPDSDVDFDPEVDLDASGRHAEIRDEDGRYLLIDTGSRNGTWLNGQRIKHAALNIGDEIEFGRGGPRLEITSVQASGPEAAPMEHHGSRAPRREPRFDPLAMPITTATNLDELVGQPGLLPDDLRLSDPPAPSERATHRKRSTGILWAAAGLVLLAAISIVVRATLQ
jgi:pSer/pThr/pTyr-binding forkhead associated (FHA) protein